MGEEKRMAAEAVCESEEEEKGRPSQNMFTCKVSFFFFLDFIYLFESEREHEQGGRGEREADSLLSRELDTGLDHRTKGRCLRD